jgi:hypothetical protein
MRWRGPAAIHQTELDASSYWRTIIFNSTLTRLIVREDFSPLFALKASNLTLSNLVYFPTY